MRGNPSLEGKNYFRIVFEMDFLLLIKSIGKYGLCLYLGLSLV